MLECLSDRVKLTLVVDGPHSRCQTWEIDKVLADPSLFPSVERAVDEAVVWLQSVTMVTHDAAGIARS
jgi:hypothetical protein